MTRAPSVLVCGHVTLDRYGDRLLAGGTAYYAAHAYRALGARVRLVTACGDDFPACALDGLEVQRQHAAATTRFTNVYDRAGARAQYSDAVAPAISPRGLPDSWRGAEVLHLGPVMREIDLAGWVAAARPGLVGIGVQGWVRAVEPGGRVAQPPWCPAPGELALVQAATLGEEDLVGQGDLLDRLLATVPIVALTRGARGCDVYVRGRVTRVGVYPATAVDPTGAGDVFAAGFLLGLATGATAPEAARLGAAAASIVVEAPAGDALGRIGEAHARTARVPIE